MQNNLHDRARKYVLSLLGYNGTKPLFVISKNTCSEVSRLLAVWYHQKLLNSEIFVAKGKLEKIFHDLLIIKFPDKFYIVDPTVWQFFKNKKSILIAEGNSAHQALKILAEVYGGKWKISEQVISYSKAEIQRFKRICLKHH